jgi:hypothetical protein
MFKIIGADQKEYGPVSADQIRQWLTEGRLNAQTRAQRETGGDWQPLSAFEEFADVLRLGSPTPASPAPMSAPAPGAPFAPTGSRESALSAVKGPAIALIITASLGVAYYLFNAAISFISGGPMIHQDMSNVPPEVRSFLEGMRGPGAGLVSLVIVGINAFVLLGAIKMLRLQSHTLAIIACIVAMLPCSCCCVLGLPFGIWGLVVLNKPEVKSQFEP